MLKGIPENLYKDVFVAMFESLLRTHGFFDRMNKPCMVAVASCTKVRVYVRGEVVRPERNLRTAGQMRAEMNATSNIFEEEGIRFLQKGAIHSGWDLQIMLFPPAMFDEDVFFSLHLASRTSAMKMYAVEYCEVAMAGGSWNQDFQNCLSELVLGSSKPIFASKLSKYLFCRIHFFHLPQDLSPTFDK